MFGCESSFRVFCVPACQEAPEENAVLFPLRAVDRQETTEISTADNFAMRTKNAMGYRLNCQRHSDELAPAIAIIVSAGRTRSLEIFHGDKRFATLFANVVI